MRGLLILCPGTYRNFKRPFLPAPPTWSYPSAPARQRRQLGDGQPARLGLLGGGAVGAAGGEDGFKRDERWRPGLPAPRGPFPATPARLLGETARENGFKRSESCLQRLMQTLWHTRRRCGGLLLGTVVQRETGAKACGVQDAAKARGAAPREQRDALGVRAGRRTVSPHHPIGGVRGDRRRRTRRGLLAPTSLRDRDASATHQTRSGRGPGEGFLADTRRSNQGWVGCELQMPEDLADHLALRDSGDDPQRPPLTERAACHIQRKDALQQPCPAPTRRRGVRRLLVHPLLTRRGNDRPTQRTVRRQTAPMQGQRANTSRRLACPLAPTWRFTWCIGWQAGRWPSRPPWLWSTTGTAIRSSRFSTRRRRWYQRPLASRATDSSARSPQRPMPLRRALLYPVSPEDEQRALNEYGGKALQDL
jgi:hypothetical protein